MAQWAPHGVQDQGTHVPCPRGINIPSADRWLHRLSFTQQAILFLCFRRSVILTSSDFLQRGQKKLGAQPGFRGSTSASHPPINVAISLRSAYGSLQTHEIAHELDNSAVGWIRRLRRHRIRRYSPITCPPYDRRIGITISIEDVFAAFSWTATRPRASWHRSSRQLQRWRRARSW